MRSKRAAVLFARTVCSGNGESIEACLSTSIRTLFREGFWSSPVKQSCRHSVRPSDIRTGCAASDDALSQTGCPSRQLHHAMGSSNSVHAQWQQASWQPSQQCSAAGSLANLPVQPGWVHWTAATVLGSCSMNGLARRFAPRSSEVAPQRRSLQSSSQQTRVLEANALMQVGLPTYVAGCATQQRAVNVSAEGVDAHQPCYIDHWVANAANGRRHWTYCASGSAWRMRVSAPSA